MARTRTRQPPTDRSSGNHSGGNHSGGNHAGGNHSGGNHSGGNHAGHRHDHAVQAEVLLRERGLKVTTPRLLVLKALLDAHRPTSAQELLDALIGEGLDQVTVYRTLTTLTEINLAQQVSTTDGSRRFEVHVCEGCRVDHPHLQCRVCGALDCLEEGIVPSPLIPTRLGGYLIDEAKLYLFGTCPKCQSADKKRPTAEKPAASPAPAAAKTPRSPRTAKT